MNMKTLFNALLWLTASIILSICLAAMTFIPQELDVRQFELYTGGECGCAGGWSDCNGDEYCTESYAWCGVGSEGEYCVTYKDWAGPACYFRDPVHCYNGRTNEGCCILV